MYCLTGISFLSFQYILLRLHDCSFYPLHWLVLDKFYNTTTLIPLVNKVVSRRFSTLDLTVPSISRVALLWKISWNVSSPTIWLYIRRIDGAYFPSWNALRTFDYLIQFTMIEARSRILQTLPSVSYFDILHINYFRSPLFHYIRPTLYFQRNGLSIIIIQLFSRKHLRTAR